MLSRPPAVAGAFYPGAAQDLRTQVSSLLASAAAAKSWQPKALIVPHAGYVYSGSIAASAYACLQAYRCQYSRVILLGPAHRVRLRGLAVPSVQTFATPLGEIPLDVEAINHIRGFPQVSVNDDAHALEHSLEVQLPFLQEALGSFALVPLAVGAASVQEVAEVLDVLWGADETLVVVSSDLSHYQPYATAKQFDAQTARKICSLTPDLNHEQACGATPVNGLLQIARQRALRPRMLDLRNSGDTAGDKLRVVGYASFAFYTDVPEAADPAASNTDGAVGPVLLGIARASISARFGIQLMTEPDAPFLHAPGCSFVTLMRQGKLRGCIGNLTVQRSILEDVRANACAAAFQDPRFAPLQRDELDSLVIEVSLLSALQSMAFVDESDALSQLRPGVDGLVLEHGGRRATFLPQVWDSLPEPRRFISELKRKAGLAADAWDAGLRLSRYTVSKWSEARTA